MAMTPYINSLDINSMYATVHHMIKKQVTGELLSIDDFRIRLAKMAGIANIMIIERNIDDLPFDPTDVFLIDPFSIVGDNVITWLENHLSYQCRIESQNRKIWFESSSDAIMFYLALDGINENS